jgi:hypothetical protein
MSNPIIKSALLSYGMSGRVFHAPFIDLHPGFSLAGAWERTNKNRKPNKQKQQNQLYPWLYKEAHRMSLHYKLI